MKLLRVLLLGSVVIKASAQIVPLPDNARPTKADARAAKVETLPIRRVSLYRNGVGFVEQSGKVTGDEIVQLALSPAQLNDAVNSLTAVDLGGGKVTTVGYGSSVLPAKPPFTLPPSVGPDPTLIDFLRVMKGARVAVVSAGKTFTGRLMNVEVRHEPVPKVNVPLERRFVSVMSDAGALRSFELTPAVEVRLLGKEQQEIGRYLQMLEDPDLPGPKPLLIEDRGTGERELQVSYLTSVPAWKSTYRLLFADNAADAGKVPQMATMQGWAVVDNTGAVDWDNVQLTLVSGAPQSFVQQISAPLQFVRPNVAMPTNESAPAKIPAAVQARFDPLGEGQGRSVALSGGGSGIQLEKGWVNVTAGAVAQTNHEEEDAAEDSVAASAPQQVSAQRGEDLVEYKFDKPVTLKHGGSLMVPLLQSDVEATRVAAWSMRFQHRTMRAVWLKNTSNFTLDAGSFSLVEGGAFAGEGQIGLMHPGERDLVPYAQDEAVTVRYVNTTTPKPAPGRINVFDGTLSVHRRTYRELHFTVENRAATVRKVVIESARTKEWRLEKATPAAQMTDDEYRFELDAKPGDTTSFKVLESHSHPTHYDLMKVSVKQMEDIEREPGVTPEVVSDLQPILDAKKTLTELDKKIAMDEDDVHHVSEEEMRIRKNVEALKGTLEAPALSKRYADEMSAQEDKLAAARADLEKLRPQREVAEKELEAKVRDFKMDVAWSPQPGV